MIILDSLPVSKASSTETGPSNGPSRLDIPPPYLPHHRQADSDTASETTHVEKVNKRKGKRRRKWILIFVGFVLYTAGLTTLLALVR
ncbi:hypothetical protein BS47DRAFT_1347791 [Hydnum rufescens UP504]|uniref:Transmembrane protein n=1 Tax=Hydnum rufescens UP504 TaxID=1448309 RepID=A0A9P6ARJ4_9AGAM|nr:hypothetical protein BS47DRAFT_1347791 [Hydnum rufescens UP504]